MKSASFILAWLVGLLGNPLSFAQAPAADQRDNVARSAWWSVISKDLRDRDYTFRPRTDAIDTWSAQNTVHHLRSEISRAGLQVDQLVVDVDKETPSWTLTLQTTSFGRLGAVSGFAGPKLDVSSQRAELDLGPMVEWFENKPEGIEHGFTIPTPPPGVGRLWIGLHFGGDLHLSIDDSATSATLIDSGGEVELHYGNLVVVDATGRILPARLASGPAGDGIEIDDAGAVYPVTVDPALTGKGWTAEGDQVGAEFGYSVASAGDVNGDGYDDVIVGAPHYDNGEVDEGAAFVYLGSAEGLSATAAWRVESNQAGAAFGNSVSSAGDVNNDGYCDVIVCAWLYDSLWHSSLAVDFGGAWVYLGSAAGLSTNPSWTNVGIEGAGGYLPFGFSVASAGDVNNDGYDDVVIGDPRYLDPADFLLEGAAFVYQGSMSGLPTAWAWRGLMHQLGAAFGYSVAAAGDVNKDGYSDLITGAILYDGGQTDEGSAFLYSGSSSGLSTAPSWTAGSNQSSAALGTSVASAGDVNHDGYGDVIVGAPYFDNGQIDEGLASVYLGSVTGLSVTAAWKVEGNEAGALLGFSVATAGDRNGDHYSDVVVGAPHQDRGQTDEGTAFIYPGSGTGLASSPNMTIEGNQSEADLGHCVATAGDVNGDGYDDVVVGANLFDHDQIDEGRAYLVKGVPYSWRSEGQQWEARFGFSVAAGDVNGDGYSDVIAGTPFYDNGPHHDVGRADLFLGSLSGPAAAPSWTAIGGGWKAVNHLFGYAVSSAGDVNADGYCDVIIGVPQATGKQLLDGNVVAYHGGPSGLPNQANWQKSGDHGFRRFGFVLSAAGDVNDDGFDDVIVGCEFAKVIGNVILDVDLPGRAWVFLGSQSGLGTSAAWTADNGAADDWGLLDQFGCSVSGLGDVNGDGTADILVGDRLTSQFGPSYRRGYVWYGGSSGLGPNGRPANADWQATSTASNFAYTVASGGDANGDGFMDVMIAKPSAAFLWFGSSSGLGPEGTPSNADWEAHDGTGFADSIGTAGDPDGDGFDDVLVGSNGTGFSLQSMRLFRGSPTGPSLSPSWQVYARSYPWQHGQWWVSKAGDVNGDGFDDVLVGENWAGYSGALNIYFGNNSH